MKRINIICAVFCAVFILAAGCSSGGSGIFSAPTLPDTTSMREVYADASAVIEAGELHTAACNTSGSDASQYCLLRMKMTNNGIQSIAVSSQLCIEVSCGSEPCEVIGVFDDRLPAFDGVDVVVPFDGLVRPGETHEGYIAFISPADAASFDFKFALDYADNIWVEFSF